MKICFDGQPLQSEGSRTRGIGHYSRNHINKLLELDERNEYSIWLYDKEIDPGIKVGKADSYYLNFGSNDILLNNIDLRDSITKVLMKKALRYDNPDILHFSSPLDKWDIFNNSWYTGVSTVATVYDLIPLLFKEQYLTDAGAERSYMERIRFLKNLDRLLVISNSVKEDLVKVVNFNPDKIDVIYGGVDDSFRKVSMDENEKESLKQKFGIRSDFVMCTGGADYRKNLEGLIESFSMMDRKLLEQTQLVIVCRMDEDYKKRLQEIAKKHGVLSRLILPGYVTKEELIKLYSLATVFAFLSFYEGFGLPIIEAMACGVPVLTSKGSSLQEIAGEAALIVDPKNTKGAADKLELLLKNPSIRHSLIEKGYKQRKNFTWDKVAELTLQSYEKLYKSTRRKVINNRLKDNLKIAYFSPMSPIKSGISDYTEELLPYLYDQRLDIDIYVDNYEPNNARLREMFRIFNYTEFTEQQKLARYDIIIYQMGNSVYHDYLYDYMKEYPGITVMHETSFHGLINERTIGFGKLDQYIEELTLNFGEQGINEGYKVANGVNHARVYDLAVNRTVLASSLGVIVHSKYAKNIVQERASFLPIRVIPMGVADVSKSFGSNKDWPDKYELSDKDFIVGAFGYCSSNKRVLESLSAISNLIKSGLKVKLVIVGEFDQGYKELLLNEIKSLQLSEHVKLIGHVALAEFERLMGLCHCAINFRYPTVGETSATLMRLLGLGKVVFINNIGSFQDIPDNVCVKVPVGQEERYLTEVIEELINNPEKAIQIAEAASRFIQHNHSLPKVAQAYRKFIDDIIRVKSCGLDEEMLSKASDILIDDLNKRKVNKSSLEAVDYAEIIFRSQ